MNRNPICFTIMITVCTSAQDVARYIIGMTNRRPVTNLRMQKLLYFLQGFSFQRFNLPFFPDKLEAWPYGPVVREVYGYLRKYDNLDNTPSLGITNVPSCQDEMRERVRSFITEAVSTLDRFTTGGLIELSHRRGTPWFEVWNSGKGKCREIPIESIRQYFTHEQ